MNVFVSIVCAEQLSMLALCLQFVDRLAFVLPALCLYALLEGGVPAAPVSSLRLVVLAVLVL